MFVFARPENFGESHEWRAIRGHLYETGNLNRKDALFAGHDQGAENWACIASLIETCKLCGVEPQAYLTDVLTKLVNLWPASRLDELMPWAWAAERGRSLAA